MTCASRATRNSAKPVSPSMTADTIRQWAEGASQTAIFRPLSVNPRAARVASAQLDSIAGSATARIESHQFIVHRLWDNAGDTVVVAVVDPNQIREILEKWGPADDTTLAKWVRENGLELLAMSVEEALDIFQNVPAVKTKLQTLHDVGLDYIELGQAATTLSGGEAQRVKLSTELSRRATGRTLYILDEPTTGLHFQDMY